MNQQVIEVINSEVDYAISLWEELSLSERPLRDKDKPVEFWIMHIMKGQTSSLFSFLM